MIRRAFASAVVTAAALGALALAEGCGSTPNGEPTAATSTSEAITVTVTDVTCGEPLTAPVGPVECHWDVAGHAAVWICEATCVPVTQPPEVDAGAVAPPTTAEAAPSPLAAMGCTVGLMGGAGVDLDTEWQFYVWACPVDKFTMPAQAIGGYSSCSGGAVPCETDVANTSPTPNPLFGPPITGWILVGYDKVSPGGIGGGCSSACAHLVP